MYKLLNRFRFLVVLCLAFLHSPVALSQQDMLQVSLLPAENGVEFVLTNTSGEPMSVLTWETPLEAELTQDVFAISPADGGNKSLHANRAAFSGRLFKRADPTAGDFIEIDAGESIRTVIRLADYYQLDDLGLDDQGLDEHGTHHVSFLGEFHYQSEQLERRQRSVLLRDLHDHTHQYAGLESVVVSSKSVDVNLDPVPDVLFARPAGFNSCTVAQQAELALDFDESERITREAREALEGLPENERPASPRYLHWFGDYDINRYASAVDTLSKAEALMGSGQVEFSCDCQEPYFAFIRRTEPFKVNLCTFYWRARRTGTDSRAGTILHEVSHFNSIGATSDFAYGQFDASNLALSSPVRAVNNADSIEYFAENTPFIDISAGVAPTLETQQYFTLEFGVERTGAVSEGGVNFFQVTGADEIRLNTRIGDADLFVFTDSEFEDEICSSINQDSLDSCQIDSVDTVFVNVVGFENSTYTIVALKDSTELAVSESAISSISTGEEQFYTVEGAGFLQLESFVGDSDLYVYSSATRSVDSLVCDSRNPGGTSIDSCETDGMAYVAVFAVQGGEYRLSVLADAPQEQPIVDDDPVATTDPVESESPIVEPQSGEPAFTTGGGQFSSVLLALLVMLFGYRRRTYRAGFSPAGFLVRTDN